MAQSQIHKTSKHVQKRTIDAMTAAVLQPDTSESKERDLKDRKAASQRRYYQRYVLSLWTRLNYSPAARNKVTQQAKARLRASE